MVPRTKSGESSSRPESDEQESMMDESGRLWAEIHNLRRSVEALPKFIADEMARIRDSHDNTSERLRIVELDLAKDTKDTEALKAWRDGTNSENGAAGRLDELRRWQSWILGGMAVCAILGAIILVVFGAWVTDQINKRSQEHLAAVQQMITEQQSREPAAASRPK